MGLEATAQSKSSLPILEEGTVQAVCYGVVDLGTQVTPFKDDRTGRPKEQRKLAIVWEIPSVRVKGKDTDTEFPRAISRQFTNSLHEKSELFALLTKWRGKAFTKEELAGFDVFNVLGANCLLSIVHKDKKDGTKTAKVGGAIKLVAGIPVLKPENALLKYSIFDNQFNFPENMPEWMVKEIKESNEYKAVEHAKQNPAFNASQDDLPEDVENPTPTETDDIPF